MFLIEILTQNANLSRNNNNYNTEDVKKKKLFYFRISQLMHCSGSFKSKKIN